MSTDEVKHLCLGLCGRAGRRRSKKGSGERACLALTRHKTSVLYGFVSLRPAFSLCWTTAALLTPTLSVNPPPAVWTSVWCMSHAGNHILDLRSHKKYGKVAFELVNVVTLGCWRSDPVSPNWRLANSWITRLLHTALCPGLILQGFFLIIW